VYCGLLSLDCHIQRGIGRFSKSNYGLLIIDVVALESKGDRIKYGMRLSKTTLFPVVIGIIVLVAISVPYIYAASAAGNEYVFGGFLLNPCNFTRLAER